MAKKYIIIIIDKLTDMMYNKYIERISKLYCIETETLPARIFIRSTADYSVKLLHFVVICV